LPKAHSAEFYIQWSTVVFNDKQAEVIFMFRKKRLLGLIFFFVGVGMVIQYMMPGWGFLLACALIILGFWYVFAR
jgi:hypothetical protein